MSSLLNDGSVASGNEKCMLKKKVCTERNYFKSRIGECAVVHQDKYLTIICAFLKFQSQQINTSFMVFLAIFWLIVHEHTLHGIEENTSSN